MKRNGFSGARCVGVMSAAARGGEKPEMARAKRFTTPAAARGREHMDAALEALHAVEPEMIEPSYARALEFIAANSKRRSLVVLLTDLVDEEGSKELLMSLKLLRPRHLPLVVTIADRDLKAVVRDAPETSQELFTRHAEEICTGVKRAASWNRKAAGIGRTARH